MSAAIVETDDPYHFFAYELVERVYHYIEVDTPFFHIRTDPSTPRFFTDRVQSIVQEHLNNLILPLIASMNLFEKEINITKESYRNSVDVVIEMYKRKEYCENQFFIMCTSIAIWAFLARRRGLPDAAKDAIDIIKTVTTQVLHNGTFEKSSW